MQHIWKYAHAATLLMLFAYLQWIDKIQLNAPNVMLQLLEEVIAKWNEINDWDHCYIKKINWTNPFIF